MVTHDARVAVFHLEQHPDRLTMNISLDIEDFKQSYHIQNDVIDGKVVDKALQSSATWIINGELVHLEFQSLKKEDGEHFKVVYHIESPVQTIRTIEIKNEFLNDIEDHSNIIMLDVAGKYRDFRMHKNRTELSVSFPEE